MTERQRRSGSEIFNNQQKRWSVSGGAGARSEPGQEYLFPRRYRQPAEKVVLKFPTISESDGATAAERERGRFQAAVESVTGAAWCCPSVRGGEAVRESNGAAAAERGSGWSGPGVSLRAASIVCLLRARLQDPTPTIRRNREEMA